MRPLFLNRDLEFHGGVANVLLTLARGNKKENCADMRFGSMMQPSDAMRAAFADLGINLYYTGDNGYLGPALALRKIIKQDKIDVIVASSFKAGLVAKIASFGLPCRVVHYVHAVDLVLEGNFKRKLFARIARTDSMLFVSKTVEQAHRPPGHLGKSAVIYNGVRDPFEEAATTPYPRTMRSELGIPDDGLLLCYIGAFVGWKDHATVLRAFEKLDPAHGAHLLLVGKGEPGSTVEQQVATMKNPAIHVISPRPDARRLLGIVDIYVHSSRREGFGLAVVEAMLAGRPVIATREGAFMEYIEDGSNGLLAEPGDPDSFAEKIELLARDREMADRLAAAGRQACLKRFSPSGAARQICDFLDESTAERKIKD